MRAKSETIVEIIKLNPTAAPSFLAEFSKRDLDDYLRRLTDIPTDNKARPRARVDSQAPVGQHA